VSRRESSTSALDGQNPNAGDPAAVRERLVAIEKALDGLVASHMVLRRHFHMAGAALRRGPGADIGWRSE
jgi:hypothetical protein